MVKMSISALNASLLLVAVIVGVALCAPLITPYDPNAADFAQAFTPPSSEHLFGTDKMGRDVFSRVIYGARESLFYTFVLVASVVSIGGILGMIAGFFGGKIDTVVMSIADMAVSFPGMALALAIAGIMGVGMGNAVLAITVVSWTKYARLVRSIVLKTKTMEYVQAAELCGQGRFDIMRKYLIPSVVPTLVVTATSDMGNMMLELAAFSFLGLGAQSGSIEWGYMLNEGRAYFESAPWLILYPGLAIFVTVSAFNLVGDAVRDKLDPRHVSARVRKRKERSACEAF